MWRLFVALLFVQTAQAAQINPYNIQTGTSAGTVAAGNDSRLPSVAGDPTGATDSAAAIVSGATSAAVSGVELRLPSGSYLLNSDATVPAGNYAVRLDIGATLTGVGKLRLDNLIPYQVTPIVGRDVSASAYGPSFNGYGNVFVLGRYSKATGTAPVVSLFGEGDAAASAAKSWGGNFVGVASATGGASIAAELDAVAMASGASAYGLVVASAGNYAATSAVQIQSNASAATFGDGMIFNSGSVQAVSGSLIKSTGATVAQYGINLGGSYSGAEISVPSFSVNATPTGINSRFAVTASAAGNPTIAVVGAGGSPATTGNFNVQALGTNGGSVQAIVGNAVGLAVSPPGSGTINAGVQATASSNGNPTLAAMGAGPSPATTANMNVQALGTNSGSVQAIVGGVVGLAVSPPATGTANAGVKVLASANGNPSISAVGAGGSPATASNLVLNALGTGGILSMSFIRSADPTTSDIPAGYCADWENTTAVTFKHVCNFGGTLRSVAMN